MNVELLSGIFRKPRYAFLQHYTFSSSELMRTVLLHFCRWH